MKADPLVYLHWHHDPHPFALIRDEEREKAIQERLLELAVGAGHLPEDARRFPEVAREIGSDILLLPLKEGAYGEGLRPAVVGFIRTHVQITPPELAALVRGEEADLSPYADAYRAILREEAALWRDFLEGRRDDPPRGYALTITGADLEAWLQLVASSPRFPAALRNARERLEVALRAEAEEQRIRTLEAFALLRGRSPELSWPRHVYLPLEAAFAVLYPEGPPSSVADPRIQDAARLLALAAWRPTKGVYRFAPELFEELWTAPFEGPIPLEPLRHLPEYAVYVETPGATFGQRNRLRGFFAFVTQDLKHRDEELYLVWDLDLAPGDAAQPSTPYLFQAVVRLGPGLTLEDGLREAAVAGLEHLLLEDREAIRRAVEASTGRSLGAALEESVALHREHAARALSLLFFLALSHDVRAPKHPGKRPERPRPVQTKRGPRLFAAPGPTEWEVGVRYADALRRAYARAGAGAGGRGAKKRPHVRRAHWHGYWVGPRKDPEKRRLELRWIPPILVGAKGEAVALEDLPAVVWRVRPRD